MCLCKEIQPVLPKGDQSWIFIGRTDAEAETPLLWPPDVKNWLIWKDPDAEKDWRQKEKKATEDEMAGRHHRFNAYELGQTLGAGEGHRGLAVQQSAGLQRARHDSETEQQQCWIWAKHRLEEKLLPTPLICIMFTPVSVKKTWLIEKFNTWALRCRNFARF